MLFKYVALTLVVVVASPVLAGGDDHRRFNIRQANAAGAANKNKGGGDASKSNCLDPSVIQKALLSDGQGDNPDPGQVRSLTSGNNFINFCKGKTLTNGAQVKEGSCNPTPMGQIVASDKQPAVKFSAPPNLSVIKSNTPFDISMKIINFESGQFSNAKLTYYAAPQQTNAQGIMKGHSHIVVQRIRNIKTGTVPIPTEFAFFKGLNSAAKAGTLTANVATGLPVGAYRICSITTSTNHVPALSAVAQKGSTEDCIYITVVAKLRSPKAKRYIEVDEDEEEDDDEL